MRKDFQAQKGIGDDIPPFQEENRRFELSFDSYIYQFNLIKRGQKDGECIIQGSGDGLKLLFIFRSYFLIKKVVQFLVDFIENTEYVKIKCKKGVKIHLKCQQDFKNSVLHCALKKKQKNIQNAKDAKKSLHESYQIRDGIL